MPDYKASTITGEISRWTRCHQIVVDNQVGAVPTITMREEQRVTYPDGTTDAKQDSAPIVQQFTDPDSKFPLLHPETGKEIGTGTHGQLYALLYSLYFDLAAKRDAAAEKAQG